MLLLVFQHVIISYRAVLVSFSKADYLVAVTLQLLDLAVRKLIPCITAAARHCVIELHVKCCRKLCSWLKA